MYQLPGPKISQSASAIAVSAGGQAGGVGRHQPDRLHVPGGDRDRVLPAHGDHFAGPGRVAAAHVRLDAHPMTGHRQHPAMRADHPAA